MGPVGLSLLISAINGLFGIGSTIAQNQYNSPLAQRRRLRKAGLPLSYMYRGNVNQQSQAPQLSIDPQIGFKQKELANQTTLVKSQAAKNDADTTRIGIQNEIADGIKQWLLNRGKSGGKYKQYEGLTGTNQEINLNMEQDAKLAETFIKNHEQELKNIQRIVEQSLLPQGIQIQERKAALAKIRQQISNMMKQAGLMDQLQDVRDFDAFLNSTVTETIKSLPDWGQALVATILKAYSYKR